MRVMGAIIAGGSSSRMGGNEKAFLPLGGRPLLARVIARLAPQVDELAINSNGDPLRFAAFDATVVPDVIGRLTTPLAGLHACLAHGTQRGADIVVTVPSDTPFLPLDLAARLGPGPAIASSGGQDHYIVGAWPVRLLAQLEAAIRDDKMVRVKDCVAHILAQRIAWPIEPHDPFFNINTPEDLARAEALLDD
jgi:molybdenum cofactor guanylyltransferase